MIFLYLEYQENESRAADIISSEMVSDVRPSEVRLPLGTD
jgi:hypothetical protein